LSRIKNYVIISYGGDKMEGYSFFEYLKNYLFLIIIASLMFIFVAFQIWFFIEFKRMKKWLNEIKDKIPDNGVLRNNISEVLSVQKDILKLLGADPKIIIEEMKVVSAENFGTDKSEIKKGKINKWKIFGIIVIALFVLPFIIAFIAWLAGG
jgi:hypothetical protein